jgi:transposase
MAPGSMVVADKLSAQKVSGIRQCLEDAGMGQLYLPPYNPDFNSIELVFSKRVALLRRAAARSSDVICEALKIILE